MKHPNCGTMAPIRPKRGPALGSRNAKHIVFRTSQPRTVALFAFSPKGAAPQHGRIRSLSPARPRRRWHICRGMTAFAYPTTVFVFTTNSKALSWRPEFRYLFFICIDLRCPAGGFPRLGAWPSGKPAPIMPRLARRQCASPRTIPALASKLRPWRKQPDRGGLARAPEGFLRDSLKSGEAEIRRHQRNFGRRTIGGRMLAQWRQKHNSAAGPLPKCQVFSPPESQFRPAFDGVLHAILPRNIRRAGPLELFANETSTPIDHFYEFENVAGSLGRLILGRAAGPVLPRRNPLKPRRNRLGPKGISLKRLGIGNSPIIYTPNVSSAAALPRGSESATIRLPRVSPRDPRPRSALTARGPEGIIREGGDDSGPESGRTSPNKTIHQNNAVVDPEPCAIRTLDSGISPLARPTAMSKMLPKCHRNEPSTPLPEISRSPPRRGRSRGRWRAQALFLADH